MLLLTERSKRVKLDFISNILIDSTASEGSSFIDFAFFGFF